ncbi:FecCD family ABC transporter permease [Amycolatopsis umgeniensis]|uniref:Iron complex transport system permease protein n=1 Tax=Amycolatopsis umgeniensis TaxID=336628 RepID=A0A841B6M5_9PSEU|nr:iron complex transport system permease protein [Amycolatopsis umgeniensis]
MNLPRHSRFSWVLVPALFAVLVAMTTFGIAFGSVGIDLPTVGEVLWHRLIGDGRTAAGAVDQIVWNLRVPRVLLAVVVGAGLSVVGAVLQATVRNPLADPYVLGVSAGAGLLAAVAITIGSAALAGLSTSAAAFAGALGATVAVLVLGRQDGRYSPTRLVLAGVTLSYLFTGLTGFVIFQSADPDKTRSVMFWLLGSLGEAGWSNLAIPTAVVLIGCACLLTQGRALNAMVLGDDTALSLGFAVHRQRFLLLVSASLVTGVLVAVVGGVGFVGLVIPHFVRLAVGPDHRRVLPIAVLAGAIYLVAVDLLCRVIVRPAELPVGIVTSVLGAPLFLWLLRRSRAGR